MNNELTNYRETIFSKIKRYLKKFIIKTKNKKIENKKIANKKNKKNFYRGIVVIEDEEEKRLENLKKLYDNREIEETSISDEDMSRLIEMYDREIEKLRVDTERRKKSIANIIGK